MRDGQRSDLERRVTRIAALAAALAGGAAILGLVPGTVDAYSAWGKHEGKYLRDMNSGGISLLFWAAVQLACALWVYRKPSRGTALGWCAIAFFSTIAAGIGWIFEHGGIFVETRPASWVAHATGALVATTLLLLLALPFVAVASRRKPPPDAPVARVL